MSKQQAASTDQKKIYLNAEELKDFVSYILDNNKFLISKGIVPLCVNIEGEAGIGKTSSVIELMAEKEMPIIRRNLAELEDLSDLVGYPYKEHEMVNEKDPADIKWVSESSIPYHLSIGYKITGRKEMGHAEPEWIQGQDKPVCLLLDDYTRASERFIQACMTLIETQRYNNWSLPKGSIIILTTNPDNGNYSVASMDVAQKTRMLNVGFKFDVDVWAKWAEKQGIDGRSINFMLLHPEIIKGEVNARNSTMFFNAISSLPDFGDKEALVRIQMVGEGCVGHEFTTMFTLFINNKLDKLLSPKEILLNPNENYIISELRSCIGQGDKYRADIASTLASRVINFAVMYAETNPIDVTFEKRIMRLTATADPFQRDLAYLIIKKLLAGNPKKFARLMTDASMVKAASK